MSDKTTEFAQQRELHFAKKKKNVNDAFGQETIRVKMEFTTITNYLLYFIN